MLVTLRPPRDVPTVPVQKFIDEYFGTVAGMEGWRGRPRTTLPSILDNDLRTVGKRLHNTVNLEQLWLLTKEEWKALTRKIVETADAKN